MDRTWSRRVRRGVARGAAVLFLAVGTASSCTSDGPGPVDPDDDVVVIRMTTGNTFSPAEVIIAPGTKVRWVNDAQMFHTVTPQDTTQAGVFAEVETSSVGPVFEFTFNVPGQTYVYRCEPHSTDFANGMVGRIVVRAQ